MTWKPVNRTILTIGYNNVGRPIPCVGLPDGFEGRGGTSPFNPLDDEAVTYFVDTIERYGAAILTDSLRPRPVNHYVIGIGAGHNDADWAESRFQEGSHAAWLENGKGERLDEAAYEDGRPMFPREIAGLRTPDGKRLIEMDRRP